MILPRVFVDVDTQEDFVAPDGHLCVPGAIGLVENFRRLTRFAVEHGIPILATSDAHVPDDPEFADFPPHCVVGTPGQRKIEATSLAHAPRFGPKQVDPEAVAQWQQVGAAVVEKQTIDVFKSANLDPLVSSAGDVEFVVYGVATEYCVKSAVLGLRDRGQRVTVVRDAIRGVDEVAARAAIEDCRRRGARFRTTAEVCA